MGYKVFVGVALLVCSLFLMDMFDSEITDESAEKNHSNESSKVSIIDGTQLEPSTPESASQHKEPSSSNKSSSEAGDRLAQRGLMNTPKGLRLLPETQKTDKPDLASLGRLLRKNRIPDFTVGLADYPDQTQKRELSKRLQSHFLHSTSESQLVGLARKIGVGRFEINQLDEIANDEAQNQNKIQRHRIANQQNDAPATIRQLAETQQVSQKLAASRARTKQKLSQLLANHLANRQLG